MFSPLLPYPCLFLEESVHSRTAILLKFLAKLPRRPRRDGGGSAEAREREMTRET